jgi:hypothetical protein
MVERLRSNGLSLFAENVHLPGRAATATDLRNLVGFKGLREGDQGRKWSEWPVLRPGEARLARETVRGAVPGRESAVLSILSSTARRGQGGAGVFTRPARGNVDTLWHRPAFTGPFPGQWDVVASRSCRVPLQV